MPGTTSNGHYQIQQKCSLCHDHFYSIDEQSCLGCHQTELKAANDSHKFGKFRDPRNVEYLEKINALSCVSCHKEHKPDITLKTGLTLPVDFCIYCHEDVEKERPTHQELKFDTCIKCHNYHDNRALYEDFLSLTPSFFHNDGPLLLMPHAAKYNIKFTL